VKTPFGNRWLDPSAFGQ